MKRQGIYLSRYDWTVIVYYDAVGSDAEEILHNLIDVDVDSESYRRAYANLAGGLPDTGMTYSNTEERVSVVVMSHASSKAEFANTWVHEMLHCAVHIGTANDLDCHGEAIAYVAGEIAKCMQPVAAEFMCPHCE